jgi:hypothetical protein
MRHRRRYALIQGSGLGGTYQSAIADNVGGDDGGKLPGHAHTRSGSRAQTTNSTRQGADGHSGR